MEEDEIVFSDLEEIADALVGSVGATVVVAAVGGIVDIVAAAKAVEEALRPEHSREGCISVDLEHTQTHSGVPVGLDEDVALGRCSNSSVSLRFENPSGILEAVEE